MRFCAPFADLPVRLPDWQPQHGQPLPVRLPERGCSRSRNTREYLCRWQQRLRCRRRPRLVLNSLLPGCRPTGSSVAGVWPTPRPVAKPALLDISRITGVLHERRPTSILRGRRFSLANATKALLLLWQPTKKKLSNSELLDHSGLLRQLSPVRMQMRTLDTYMVSGPLSNATLSRCAHDSSGLSALSLLSAG